eukprot:2489738-Amphidinium_carterae.1
MQGTRPLAVQLQDNTSGRRVHAALLQNLAAATHMSTPLRCFEQLSLRELAEVKGSTSACHGVELEMQRILCVALDMAAFWSCGPSLAVTVKPTPQYLDGFN